MFNLNNFTLLRGLFQGYYFSLPCTYFSVEWVKESQSKYH